MASVRLSLVLALCTGVLGCGDDEPSCEKLVDHVLSEEMTPSGVRYIPTPTDAPKRKSFIRICKTEFDAKMKQCIADAKTALDYKHCVEDDQERRMGK